MNSRRSSSIPFIIFSALFFFLEFSGLKAQSLEPKYYNIGMPVLADIWVDPVNGNDDHNGASRSQALSTITAAWDRLPGTPSAIGYKINLVSGDYVVRDPDTRRVVGLYLDERHGSYACPIVIESADGPLKARIISSFDFRDVGYVYLIGLDFITDPSSYGGGNTVHFADGDHILIRNCRMNGFDGTERKPQETLKVNQVQHIYVEDSDISGAFWFSLDYVAVQYGHIQGCRIHDADEDCLLLKGGTAQIRVEDNLIYDSGRFGFSAGQGAGFDFMVVPWLHYEAYDLKFINNIIYDTGYAGIAVLGGYNILTAFNTLYKTGIDRNGDRSLLTFSLGQRGCDGAENDTCDVHHRLGGWGPGPWSNPPIPYGNQADCIPNKNIHVYNNIIYNPGKDSTIGGHFEIRAPYGASDQSPAFLQSCNLPNPVLSDDHLQIKGNIIWNGSRSKSMGLDENTGGQDANEACNRAQLLRDNRINSMEPEFVDHAHHDFHPRKNGNIYDATAYTIPDFPGTDRPSRPLVPSGNLLNSILRDFDGNDRTPATPPGAFSTSISTSVKEGQTDSIENIHFMLGQNYPNPFNFNTTIRFTLAGTGHTALKIYNTAGEEVAAPVSEMLTAGTYSIQWDAANLPSGVYIYKLQSGSYTLLRKSVLMK